MLPPHPHPPLLLTITAPGPGKRVHIVGLEAAAVTGRVGEGATALRGAGLRRLRRRLRTMRSGHLRVAKGARITFRARSMPQVAVAVVCQGFRFPRFTRRKQVLVAARASKRVWAQRLFPRKLPCGCWREGIGSCNRAAVHL